MLRIHFTAEDLGRVRLSDPDPLWETVLTLFRFRWPTAPLVFGSWRQEALRRAPRSTRELLMPLTPGGYYPDFLTPCESSKGLEAGIDAVMSTATARLRAEIALLPAAGRLPREIELLARGDLDAVRHLGMALEAQHRTAVAPFWDLVRVHVDADRAIRSRALLRGGCERLLESFRPMMRWQYPVLEVDFPVEQDLYLEGRGLRLVPAFFSWGEPDALHDPELPPVLVYPVAHDLRLSGGVGPRRTEGLEALIGATRAWVLESIGDGCTTSELARRVGVAASSISQHTAVLRDGGLVSTVRAGQSVLHTVTPLGRSLLAGEDTVALT